MTTAMKTATMASALNRVATALLVHRKPPNRQAPIPVHVHHHPDAIAMTVDHAPHHPRTRKATMTMIHSRRAISKMTFNLAPMPTWARKAVSMHSVTSQAAAQVVNPTRP